MLPLVFLTALAVGGATMLGALGGYCFRGAADRAGGQTVMAFAAGMMLSAAVAGLILPSLAGGGPWAFPVTAAGILSGEQVADAPSERVAPTGVARLPVKPGKEVHLGRRGVVVDGGVVAPTAVSLHPGALFVGQAACHVDVLGPAARDTLEEQDLLADEAGGVGPEESRVGAAEQIGSPFALCGCREKQAAHQGEGGKETDASPQVRMYFHSHERL